MRRFVSLIMIMGASLSVSAATLSDVKILEASKSIKYLTQNIAKNYLYSYIYPNQNTIAQVKVQKSIQSLEENMRTIALNTKKEKIKGILDFFAYEKEQIKLLLKKKPTASSANEVLDFSEALTEGAEKIATSVTYDFSFEDKMFLRSKNIEYLVEKLAMYYMVLESNINKTTIGEKLKQTIAVTEKDMDTIQQYTYPKELNTKKSEVFKLWNANKHYFETIGSLKVPSIVILSTNGMQNILDQFAIHHARGE